jgi:hypothetical protein
VAEGRLKTGIMKDRKTKKIEAREMNKKIKSRGRKA